MTSTRFWTIVWLAKVVDDLLGPVLAAGYLRVFG